jgi:hypothetical protein
MEVCKQNVNFPQQNPNFLLSMIICDESWYIHYVPESKQHPAIQKKKSSPELKEYLVLLPSVKVLLCLLTPKALFFSKVQQYSTVNGKYKV